MPACEKPSWDAKEPNWSKERNETRHYGIIERYSIILANQK